MTAKNRAGLITKLHSSLKKHFKPAPASPGRPLLEHILYGALLEDAPPELADEGFAKCEQEFFDWNEVRVTSVTELAEVLSKFPSSTAAALRLKRCLQSVFETFYNFDIDPLKKENLGKAVAKFESMNGMTPFVLAYVVQQGLGGHAIPVNAPAMRIMLHAGIVSDSEAATGRVPGLERAVPKNKAIEFSSLLHQASIAYARDSSDKTVWEVIRSVNKNAEMTPDKPASKQKTGKRPAKNAAPEKAAGTKTASKKAAAESPQPKSAAKSGKAAPAKNKSADAAAKPKSASAKSATKSAAAGEKKPAAKPAKKSTSAKSEGKSPAAKDDRSKAKSAPKSRKASAAKEESQKQDTDGGTQKLTKRKPR